MQQWWSKLMIARTASQFYSPVIAVCWNDVPWFVLLSIHITATVRLLDTHIILGIWRTMQSKGVITLYIFAGFCMSVQSLEPPAGQSHVDTGSLVYSSCWGPSRGLYMTLPPSHIASTPGQVDTLCHHLKQQQITTENNELIPIII